MVCFPDRTVVITTEMKDIQNEIERTYAVIEDCTGELKELKKKLSHDSQMAIDAKNKELSRRNRLDEAYIELSITRQEIEDATDAADVANIERLEEVMGTIQMDIEQIYEDIEISMGEADQYNRSVVDSMDKKIELEKRLREAEQILKNESERLDTIVGGGAKNI